MKDLHYFCDMDGVLADFNAEPNAVERFKVEKGFFKNLKPIYENVDAVLYLLEKGYDVTILTTSPHKNADREKMAWLRAQFPARKIKVIFARPEMSKISYVKEPKKSILFDDYGKNIREWALGGGGNAFKVEPNKPIFKAIMEWGL